MARITTQAREHILKRVPDSLHSVLKLPYYAANYLFASEPRYVVVGTGRCGTKFTARFLDNIGIGCSHEAYYTPDGPVLRNSSRYYRAQTDASWLAVPYLPDGEKRILHQVRHPLGVISSFYKLGFFDSKYYGRHQRYVDFARKHFEFSSSPIRSCTRWYIEWNKRCDSITDNRVRLETFSDSIDIFAEWLQLDRSVLERGADLTPVNARGSIVDFDEHVLKEQIKTLPEYSELCDVAAKYDYQLE